jgi:hypothetical protein
MSFSFRRLRIGRNARFATPDLTRNIPLYDPEGVISRINSVLRRRLSDRVEVVFQATCMAGDLETAADVLTVLANLQERERRKLGGERRISNDPVAKARDKLATSRIAMQRQQRL